MIRVGLLDTTIQGAPGSMLRYREQLQRAMAEHSTADIEVTTEFLGCHDATIQKTPARLRMWRHHFHVWRQARRLDVSNYDMVHVLDGSFGYVASAVHTPNVVSTVHDIIPRMQMDSKFPHAPPIGRGARFLIERALQGVASSRMIVADSESTAKDLDEFQCQPELGIKVVPLAIEGNLFSATKRDNDALPKRPYLFHLGNNGFYKNRIGAVEVLHRIDSSIEVDLVMAGPPPTDEIRQRIEQYGLGDRVHVEIDPNQTMVAQLYQNASALVFPSLYEGFGWPPLEAMSADCPVVSSDAGSLPEVMGEAGIVAPAGDYDTMARGCERILSEQDFRQSLVQAGNEQVERFSLKRLAESMSSVYQKIQQGSQ